MNVLEILRKRGDWVTEHELCQMAVPKEKEHLVRPLTTKLFTRRLVDVRVDGRGRAFRINSQGIHHEATRTVSTFSASSRIRFQATS